nr:hypothetical protein [Anaerolineae bacterium]
MSERFPVSYADFHDRWSDPEQRKQNIAAYTSGECSFIPHLLPELAVALPVVEVLKILRGRLDDTLDLALDPRYTDPDRAFIDLPVAICSPVVDEPDGNWLKRSKMVGINVRTVGSHWQVVHYTLTLPAAQDSIQLLPIWEPGVVGSLYGISSWNLNPEFFNAELAETIPHLDTTAKQLKAAINILHALGKTVGMDVIPHTDRFSEIALANPHYFEWLQRQDICIIDHAANLHEDVQACIWAFLQQYGPALSGDALPGSADLLFNKISEIDRLRVLFGLPDDFAGRALRRRGLVAHLHRYGYEPVPATMAPPYRGIEVDPFPEALRIDVDGLVWRDYRITHPEPMSRVFGPLARYKLYERLDNNKNWEIDFSRPREEVWNYVCEKYTDVQQRFAFDFMRGDMSHVQMRPEGVPDTIDRYYDLLGAVKQSIRERGTPYFGYFAESFLAPADVLAYGDEVDHLEAAQAEVTLGDLQSAAVGSPEFLRSFRQYLDLAAVRAFAPSFTVMTADKDDPRFDHFYLKGNEVRLFIALFLGDMPAYMGLGFEARDIHHTPAPNEHYTKLYVFRESDGPKATTGPYIWGKNGFLYHQITRLKLYLEQIDYLNTIAGQPTQWLLHPDPVAEKKVIAWTQQRDHPDSLFIANTDCDNPVRNFALPGIPGLSSQPEWALDFSTSGDITGHDQVLRHNGIHYKVGAIGPGEGRVYRVKP